nr:DNA methyltransferase [Myxosarcina sp. GI1]
MNRRGVTPAGRYKGVDYFNGGLFAKIHPIELTKEELKRLDEAARENWQQVRPAIFGNIFEGTANKEERHAYGMHFTSEADIMKIVKPTISNYWDEKIEAANSISELNSLQLELQNYRVLDPVCGSGNFLYIAYQELKEIEKSLLNKISERRRSETLKQQVQMGLVTPLQFYGMDINPFAVELAKVTLTIAKKVAIDRLELTEPELPLDTLDKNIVCTDALFTPWVKANAIIGNPPFLGGYRLRSEFGNEYTEKVFKKFPDVKGQVDFCSYWFRVAHDNIDNTRVGFVGTNSISQGQSKTATLDYIIQNGGYINEAISSQTWSGEAKVHVSIVNWSKVKPKKCYLDNSEVDSINSSLKTTIDVSKTIKIKANKNKCFTGVLPNGDGFIITDEQYKQSTKEEEKNKNVLKLLLIGENLTQNPKFTPARWIIDFNNMSIEEASSYKLPFEWLKSTIPVERKDNRNDKLKTYWWKYEGIRTGMRKALSTLSYCFMVSEVSKWCIFVPCNTSWLPARTIKVVASDDYYVLGILTSNIHRLWVQAQSSTLEDRTRYTNTTCFETFPFPQMPRKDSSRTAPTKNLIQQIRNKAIELH